MIKNDENNLPIGKQNLKSLWMKIKMNENNMNVISEWNDKMSSYQCAYIQFSREKKRNVHKDIVECVKLYYRCCKK